MQATKMYFRKDPEETRLENLSSEEFYQRVRLVMDQFNLLPWLYTKAPGKHWVHIF